MIYKTNYKSPIGNLLIASDGKSIIGLWIEGQKYYLSGIKENMKEDINIESLQKAKEWLNKYFKGEKVYPNELKLKLQGTEFQKTVWKLLCDIPYGETTTYGEIAKKVAKIRKQKKYVSPSSWYGSWS